MEPALQLDHIFFENAVRALEAELANAKAHFTIDASARFTPSRLEPCQMN